MTNCVGPSHDFCKLRMRIMPSYHTFDQLRSMTLAFLLLSKTEQDASWSQLATCNLQLTTCKTCDLIPRSHFVILMHATNCDTKMQTQDSCAGAFWRSIEEDLSSRACKNHYRYFEFTFGGAPKPKRLLDIQDTCGVWSTRDWLGSQPHSATVQLLGYDHRPRSEKNTDFTVVFLQILVVYDPRRDLRLGPLHLTSHRVVVENLAGVCSARGRLELVPSARGVVGRVPRHLASGQGRAHITHFLSIARGCIGRLGLLA